MRFLVWFLLLACWAVAQSSLFKVGKILSTVPGQRGSYIVKLDDGVQVKLGDRFVVEGVSSGPIELVVSAIEGDSVMVRTTDQRVILSAGTEVGSRTPLTAPSGQGVGQTGGAHASRSASQERGPSASSESVLAQERGRLQGTSIRDRYDDPVVTNAPISPDQVYTREGVYAQNDVSTPMQDFNNQQSRQAADTTDGLPSNSPFSSYNQPGTSGASGFERGGKGSYDSSLPATFVVEKSYFFLDNQKNVCLRLKVRNKGGQPGRFQVACDCTNVGGKVVYSVTKEFAALDPGAYDYFSVVTALRPRTEMFGTGYVNSASMGSTIETSSFGEVRVRPRAEALKD